MPSRFFDYESDLRHLARKGEDQSKTGLRQPTTSRKPRRSSASEHASTGSTRSSVSSTGSSGVTNPPAWRTGHRPSRSTPLLSAGSHNVRDPHREEQVEPTAQIQEWAHQMHIQQQRQYWWCSSCYPKVPTLQVPTKKTMKRVRIAEPTHAYE